MPLPPRLRGAPEAAYVGRAAGGRGASSGPGPRAAAGRGGLVLLAGEPGIGKTRLASRQAFAVHAAGGTVLYGAVDEGLGVPYQPWIEALGHYLDHAPDGLLERYVAEAGADLVPAAPRPRPAGCPTCPPLVASDGETERYLLLQAITRLPPRGRGAQPGAARARRPPLGRQADAAPARPPAPRAGRRAGALRRHLPGLRADRRHPLADAARVAAPGGAGGAHRARRASCADDIVELLEAISRQEPTPAAVELARLLQRDTNGNPLFVAEVLRDLLEQGHLARGDDGVWALTTPDRPAPGTGQRARRRDPARRAARRREAQRVLATAAVIGRDFELDLLGAAPRRAAGRPPGGDRGGDGGVAPHRDRGPVRRVPVHPRGDRAGPRRRALRARAASSSTGGSRPRSRSSTGPSSATASRRVAGHLLAAGRGPRARPSTTSAAPAPTPWPRSPRTRRCAGSRPRSTCYDRSPLADARAAVRHRHRPRGGDARRRAPRVARPPRLGGAAGRRAPRRSDRLARAILAMNRSIATSVGTADQELIATMEAALELVRPARRDPGPPPRPARRGAVDHRHRSTVGAALVEEALSIARDARRPHARPRDHLEPRRLLHHRGPRGAQGAARRSSTALLPGISDPQLAGYAAVWGVWTSLESADRLAVAGSLDDARRASAKSPEPALAWLLLQLEAIVARIDGGP